MSEYVDRAMAPTRFSLVLIAVFGAVAAVLAAIGLYGVLATAVRQRTAEIGVRMAFGASNESIFRLMIGEGLALSGIGIVVGLLAAFALTGVMEKASMLVAIKPTDPATYASIAVLVPWRSRSSRAGCRRVGPRACNRRRRSGRSSPALVSCFGRGCVEVRSSLVGRRRYAGPNSAGPRWFTPLDAHEMRDVQRRRREPAVRRVA